MSRAGVAQKEPLNFLNTEACNYNKAQADINALIVSIVTGYSKGST